MSLTALAAADVVRQPDEEEQQDERDPERGDLLVDLPLDRAAADALDDREGDVAAVERQERQQVEQGEREADEPDDREVVLEPLRHRLCRGANDPDRSRDLLAALAVDEVADRSPDLLRQGAGQLQPVPERFTGPD